MTASIDLVAHSGPLEGSRIELRPDRPLLIGRSYRGVHLADPLVSIEHAEIAWVTESYWVTDLGSLTGTFLDGERITEDAKPLYPGSILRIGESDFRVVVRSGWPPWAVPFLALAVILGVVATLIVMQAVPGYEYDPWIAWKDGPIHTPEGPVEVEGRGRLQIPLDFIRREGVDYRDLHLRKVKDFDGDGVDEFWLEWGDKAGIFTFDERGGWRSLGYVPKGCREGAETPWLELRCDGTVWRFDGTAYAPASQEGVVAWVDLRPPPEASEEAPRGIVPYRVTLTDRAQLAGFFQARGVLEPVHYLICEEAVPGMLPQVLTANGVRTLDHACISQLHLQGFKGAEELTWARSPIAVAFTATGYEALKRDLTRMLSGDDSGRFFSVDDRTQPWLRGRAAVAEAFFAKPKWRVGATKLSFEGTAYHVDIVASESRQVEPGTLGHTGRGLWPAPPVVQTDVPHFGESVDLDPPGCSLLHIHTEPEGVCLKRKWCRPGSTFLTVEERGCPGYDDPILEVSYAEGQGYVQSKEVEVLVELDRSVNTEEVQVLRAHIAARPLQERAQASHGGGDP